MHWRLKALAFRAGGLPGAASIHYLLQRHVTKNWPRQQKSLESLKEKARAVLNDYAQNVGGLPDTVLEIGAGRDLAVPLALRQFGVSKVVACDVERLAKLDLIRHASKTITHGQIFPFTWGELEAAGIGYRAPESVNGEAVDCTCSNEVLEHVPLSELPDLLASLRRITKGLTVHSIDYSDHYARSDSTVSRLNFLRYSERQWRKYNSRAQYVNRLRHGDYLKLFEAAGFKILEQYSAPGPMIDFDVAPEFRRYEPSDLFAIKGRIVAA